MNFLPNTSLGSLGLRVGGVMAVVGLIAYATGNSTINLIGFFYGIPILLGGLALKASELKPVRLSQPTPPTVATLREQQSTSTQTQIRRDVMRYRYGQEAHLDESLAHLGMSPSDEERPLLAGLREEEIDGAYALVLEFESPLIPLETWQEKQEKIAKFFGPGLRAEAKSAKDEDRIDLSLIATSQGN
jgi:Protein of unknown function (DUF2854)